MDIKNSKMQINEFGDKTWVNLKKQYHREDGPAVEEANGDKFWFQNGKYHRLDGPADEYIDGYKSWWVENKYLMKEEFNSWILRIKKLYLG